MTSHPLKVAATAGTRRRGVEWFHMRHCSRAELPIKLESSPLPCDSPGGEKILVINWKQIFHALSNENKPHATLKCLEISVQLIKSWASRGKHKFWMIVNLVTTGVHSSSFYFLSPPCREQWNQSQNYWLRSLTTSHLLKRFLFPILVLASVRQKPVKLSSHWSI